MASPSIRARPGRPGVLFPARPRPPEASAQSPLDGAWPVLPRLSLPPPRPAPRPTAPRPGRRLLTAVSPCSAIRISRPGRHTLLNFCLHAALTFSAFAGGINRTRFPTLCQAVSAVFIRCQV